MDWLIKDHLRIPIDSESVYFIKTPAEFYTTLMVNIFHLLLKKFRTKLQLLKNE